MIELAFKTRVGEFRLDVAAKARTPGIVGLFGPSGAGKTTLLRAIAGLQPLESGQIILDATALCGPPEGRRIAYVFQDSRLFPHLNVRENLLYGYKRAPAPPALAPEDVIDALAVAPLLNRFPHGLSGGEQKRVAIGRALLSQPRLILMDEPLAGVDDARTAEIVELILRVRSRFRAAIVFVSHDLNSIAALADDVLIMEAGRVVCHGAAVDVFADPESPLSSRPDARALVEGTIKSSDPAQGTTTLWAGPSELTAPWLDVPPGTTMRLQVFARDVALAASAPASISTQNILPAKITALRTRKDRLTLVALETPVGNLLASITHQATERMGLAPGKNVYALVKASAFAPRNEG
jgi:molybdate transport system ATP-binding protein